MKTHVIYSFSEYLIDPAKRELWRGDERVSLQPKAFECLAYLVENRDRAVGRDELISAVWGRVDVADNSLDLAVARARHALGDNGEEQRLIRTIPRVGYSWVGAVEEAAVDNNGNGVGHANGHDNDEAAQAPAGGGEPPPVPPGKPSRLRIIPGSRTSPRWLGLTAALLVATAFTVLVPGGSQPPVAPVQGETAVVLPVTLIGDSGSGDAWIRLGIMDLIAERLRELGQLVVPSDNTVALARTYLDANGTEPPGPDRIEALARTAVAGLVLDVQAETVGNRWRVSLRSVHGPAVVAQGDAEDLLIAAGAAADRMAVMLGHELAVSDAHERTRGNRIDYVLQQARAAVLSDRFDEADRLLDGLDEAQRNDFQVRLLLADIDTRRGRYEEAAAAFENLLAELPEASENRVLRGKALHGLGHCASRQGDYTQSIAYLRKALELLEENNDYESRLEEGRALMSLATIQKFQGDMSGAQANYARARIAFEIVGDQYALAKLDGNLSELFVRLGRSEAISYGRRAIERLGQFGDVQNELKARAILLIAHHNSLDSTPALAEARELDDLLANTGDPTLVNEVLLVKLAVLFQAGHLKEAGELVEQLRGGTSRSDLHRRRIDYLTASAAIHAGEYELAARKANSALEGRWPSAMDQEHAHARLVLLQAQIRTRPVNEARQIMEKTIAWRTSASDDPAIDLIIALMQAELAAAEEDAATAALYFEQALVQADQWASPQVMLLMAESYTQWLIAHSDLEQAAVVVGRVSPWVDKNYTAALVQLRLYHAMGETTAWRLALERARALAGQRSIPPELLDSPVQLAATP